MSILSALGPLPQMLLRHVTVKAPGSEQLLVEDLTISVSPVPGADSGWGPKA